MDEQFDALQRALAGRYSLQRELGRGGMGVVYLGHEVMLDRPVAIKVLPPQLGASDELRLRFLQEARTAARLQHPNIVPVYVVDEVEQWILIAMAYVDGGTLAERVRERGRLPQSEAVRVLREVGLALAYAHRRGVVHRDIKPENILLDRDSGRAMVTDFGIAHGMASGGLTAPGLLLGTPDFMSPEQASGDAVDGRSDLYALGVLGYYLLAGRLPFRGTNARDVLAKHLTEQPPPLATVAPGVAARVAVAVDRCLAKDASERFQSGEDLAEALEQAEPVKRALPESLRRWLSESDELTLAQTAIGSLFSELIFAVLDMIIDGFLETPSSGAFHGDVAVAVAFGLPPIIYLARRAQLLRATRKNGFDSGDLCRALDATARAPDALARRQGLLVSLLGAGALTIIWSVAGASLIPAWGYDYGWESVALFAVFGGLTLGAWGHVIYRLARAGRSWTHDARRAFWGSRVGAWVARLVGVGVSPIPAQGDATFRGTELALGSAIDVLYAALPKPMRERLPELPAAVAGLEAAVQRERSRLAALEALAAQAQHALGRPDSDPAVGDRRSEAARAIDEARSAAETVLRDAVAALEMLRLDLLRLNAGADALTSITADIDRALALSRDMEAEASAIEDVRGLLSGP